MYSLVCLDSKAIFATGWAPGPGFYDGCKGRTRIFNFAGATKADTIGRVKAP